jgi:putative transposase
MRLNCPVRLACKALQVSASGYYAWLGRGEKPRQKEERLSVLVLAAHDKTRCSYGAERLHKELVADGCAISLWMVKKIRKRLGITCKRKRRIVRTTNSNHGLPVAPNLVGRNFEQPERNRVWVSDITYIPTGQGWVYLAGIKDLCSKEIVGFSLSERIDTNLVLTALTRAIHLHRPPPGLILHSDRGSQYCSMAYQEKLKDYGIICSMSKKGDCYDNAPMESFWGILKNELVHHRHYTSYHESIHDISEYIEMFYNDTNTVLTCSDVLAKRKEQIEIARQARTNKPG